MGRLDILREPFEQTTVKVEKIKLIKAVLERRGNKNYSYKIKDDDSHGESDGQDEAFSLPSIKNSVGQMSNKNSGKVDPYTADMEVNGKILCLEVDTGCNLAVMNETNFQETWGGDKRPPTEDD